MPSPELIYETLVTTAHRAPDGTLVPHVAPMGLRRDGRRCVLMPFRPSGTLDNILTLRTAVVNFSTDARIFAGCVTGRRDWSTVPAQRIEGLRLASTLGHAELALTRIDDHPQRPVLHFDIVHEATHAPFPGFNRAQSAVLEGAVLISRLHLLPAEKIATELAYLQIAIDKCAGPAELQAWGWLLDAVAAHRAKVNA